MTGAATTDPLSRLTRNVDTTDSWPPVPEDMVDDTGAKVILVAGRAATLLDVVRDGIADGEAPRSAFVGYVADLAPAVRVGEDLVDTYGVDMVRDHFAALPQQDHRRIRAAIVPVADHVGIDLTAEEVP